jgi:hypothetical protein
VLSGVTSYVSVEAAVTTCHTLGVHHRDTEVLESETKGAGLVRSCTLRGRGAFLPSHWMRPLPAPG